MGKTCRAGWDRTGQARPGKCRAGRAEATCSTTMMRKSMPVPLALLDVLTVLTVLTEGTCLVTVWCMTHRLCGDGLVVWAYQAEWGAYHGQSGSQTWLGQSRADFPSAPSPELASATPLCFTQARHHPGHSHESMHGSACSHLVELAAAVAERDDDSKTVLAGLQRRVP